MASAALALAPFPPTTKKKVLSSWGRWVDIIETITPHIIIVQTLQGHVSVASRKGQRHSAALRLNMLTVNMSHPL